MRSLFNFRWEYWEYILECIEAGEVHCRFKEWFLTAYHYDIADELPTRHNRV